VKTLYVVQTVLPWDSLRIDGKPLPKDTLNGATGFLTVFDDLGKAKKFADGDEIKVIVTEDAK